MKKSFPQFYQLDEPQITKMWADGLFIFDANVILNLYTYSLKTSNELISVLEKISDRIWIPYQFALEYQKRRLGIIEEQKIIFDKNIEDIKKNLTEVKNKLEIYSEKPVLNIDEIIEKLNESQGNYPDCSGADLVRGKIDKLFEGKVGMSYDSEKLKGICKNGEYRYEMKIPPGYLDKSKDNNDPTKIKKFGDLIGWLQIIDKARESKKSIIFITSEKKEDWWQKVKGDKIVGPRYELINEMILETGVLFHMYDMNRFLEYSKTTSEISPETIKEIKEIDEKKIEINEDVVVSPFNSSNSGVIFSPEPYNDIMTTTTGEGAENMVEEGLTEVKK